MKDFSKLIIVTVGLFSLLAGTNLSAIDPHQCGANLGYIPNQTAPYNEHWSYTVPIQTYMGCDFDYDLQLIQGPSGMTRNHLTLHWDPNYSQLGQSFPVTVRLTVTYVEPYRVEVQSRTFYVTVVGCPNVDLEVQCQWEYVGSWDLRAKVFVKNHSDCYVASSGNVHVDNNFQGSWNNVAMSPNERLLVWAYTYPDFNDGVIDTLVAQFTSFSIPDNTPGNNDCLSQSQE